MNVVTTTSQIQKIEGEIAVVKAKTNLLKDLIKLLKPEKAS